MARNLDAPLLHVEAFDGAGHSTIVFLHGLAGSSASWGKPFRQLAPQHRVLLVDVLGFGHSPKPVMGYTLPDHIAALEATLEHQGVDKLCLVGHSMGALLALAFAAQYPNRVKLLVLMALPWYTSAADARRKIAQQSVFNRWLALDTPLAHLACTVMCHLRPWLIPLMPRLLKDVPPEVARDTLRHNWLSYSRSMQHLIIEARPADWLKSYPGPTLFIQGLQDETAPCAAVAAGVACLDNATLETVDAGHHMVFTHADALAARVARAMAQAGG